MSKLTNISSSRNSNIRMFALSPQGRLNPSIFNNLKHITASEPEKEYSSFFGLNSKQVSKPSLQFQPIGK